jgi:hypothetical protein
LSIGTRRGFCADTSVRLGVRNFGIHQGWTAVHALGHNCMSLRVQDANTNRMKRIPRASVNGQVANLVSRGQRQAFGNVEA